MLYYFSLLLEKFNLPGAGLMGYLSFRAMLANVISLTIALVFGKRIIRKLASHQIGESIRDLGLQGQMEKKGTPTMGGIIILISILGSALLVCNLSSIYTQLMLLTTLWCGGIGLLDDYIKVFRHNKEGLSEKKKLVLQFTLGLAIALFMCLSKQVHVHDLVTTIPFVKAHEFNYAWLSPFQGEMKTYGTWAIYVIVIIFVILSCTNGANLTDGLDGLSAGTTAIVVTVIGIMAWLGGNVIDAKFLNIMYIPGSGEVAVFMSAVLGALIGFLWYNTYPALVFMGDTGSLMIGGIVGVSAVLIRKELLLPLLCGIFLVESLSVIIQRSYFKYTKRKYGQGRRAFLMSPIHHHYQKKGMPEPRIVARFWIAGILLAIGTLALMKVR